MKTRRTFAILVALALATVTLTPSAAATGGSATADASVGGSLVEQDLTVTVTLDDEDGVEASFAAEGDLANEEESASAP
jgi:hypothetical protein